MMSRRCINFKIVNFANSHVSMLTYNPRIDGQGKANKINLKFIVCLALALGPRKSG